LMMVPKIKPFRWHGSSKTVSIITQENQGASAARNRALALSQGESVQWLDADDLLAPNKIAKQVEALNRYGSKQTLFSSAWGYFYYRLNNANFISHLALVRSFPSGMAHMEDGAEPPHAASDLPRACNAEDDAWTH